MGAGIGGDATVKLVEGGFAKENDEIGVREGKGPVEQIAIEKPAARLVEALVGAVETPPIVP